MRLWQEIRQIFRKAEGPLEHKEGEEILLNRYRLFQLLLNENNAVLKLMAEMEERASAGIVLDRQYFLKNIPLISEKVRKIIDALNQISMNSYQTLIDRFLKINTEIIGLLARKFPPCRFTAPLEEIDRTMGEMFGNKTANLGEIKNRLGMPTPEGFGISTSAFLAFMEHNNLFPKIDGIVSGSTDSDPGSLLSKSTGIQKLFDEAEIPADVEKAILNACSVLEGKFGPETMMAVRSSAVQEDGEYSFAGQYSSFLNVPRDMIVKRYKQVLASLYNQRAISYYKETGFQEHEMIMAVGILTMIDAKSAGVMYTRDPAQPRSDDIIINAVHGLGRSVVEGTVTPQMYRLARHSKANEEAVMPAFRIIERRVPGQELLTICKPEGDLAEVPLPEGTRGSPCLSDEAIRLLAEYGVTIERHYQYPQDIEWALGRDDVPYIVQARPLEILDEDLNEPVPPAVEGYDILINRGITASKGIAFGKAYVVKSEEDLKKFPEGGVLVARNTSTQIAAVMNKVSAVVTDIGGATVHLATIAREFRIPAIFDTESATTIIRDGQEVTVDATHGKVYSGKVRELAEFGKQKPRPERKPPFFGTIGMVIKKIVPLHLVDPAGENFLPEFCITFHDIIRFAHQKAMHEMFHLSGESPDDIPTVRLSAGIPLLIHIIDLGDGLKEKGRSINPDHVSSVPFSAFLRGLKSVDWPGPRHVDLGGILGMIAHTASIPETELAETAETSFAFISKVYMNFSIRLGYHLSVVEAYAGDNINDNYIHFFFKGGGADMDRRLRRVWLISEILQKLDFRVKLTEDIIDAVITKHHAELFTQKLELLGKLTVYTKQLDALMAEHSHAEFYLQDFVSTYLEKL